MPATTTLSQTTLAAPCDAHESVVKLASVSGVLPGYRLFVDGELMAVQRLGIETYVYVARGVDGTAGAAHSSEAVVYIGQGHQFYSRDPVGIPRDAIPVSPYINLSNGKVWFAQGDTLPDGNAVRWYQEQTVTHEVGALGVRTTTLDPTEST